jgi:TRAP-type C4-dicarboxylate transport system substrate-binding protein
MREQWRGWEQRSRKQAMDAGVTVIDAIDRKAFEDATAALRNELAADPKLAPLLRRIEAAR